MAPEHNAISSRARYFPMPLKLDGRFLNGASVSPNGKLGRLAGQAVHPQALMVRRLLVTRAPAMLVPAGRSWLCEVEGRVNETPGCSRDTLFFQRAGAFLTQFSRIEHEQPWFPVETTRYKDPPEMVNCHAEISLPLDGTGLGEVTFVKHGVSLTPMKARLAWPGARAVVSLAVTTDLSQFTAVKSPALDNVLLYLDAHVRSMRNDLRFHLDRMRLGQPELFEHFAKLG